MRILHISKYDLKGGASRAAFSSVQAQRKRGVDAHLLVAKKNSSASFVHAPSGTLRYAVYAGLVIEKFPELLGNGVEDTRSLHTTGLSAAKIQNWFLPDIVIAHKIDGILPLREIQRFTIPVIWRMHDMWSLCGTQHYAPEGQVLDGQPEDWPMPAVARRFESWMVRRKRRIYANCKRLILCPPSNWLAECVKRSSLLPDHAVEVVPNGVDTDVFAPQDQMGARDELGLPRDKPIILFGAAGGAADRRKGFDLLLAALAALEDNYVHSPHLLVFGGDLPETVTGLGYSASSVGAIRENKTLAKVYASADVFVAPSRQENLSLTVLESLACGTPAVAFAIGGMTDMIRPGVSGLLAEPFDVADLTGQISKIIDAPIEERVRLREEARALICREFSMEAEAGQMLDLARRLVEKDW